MLRVARLDDQPAALAGLRRLLGSTGALEAVSASDNAPQLMRELVGARPDVVVLAYDLARGDGLTLCQTLEERFARPPSSSALPTVRSVPAASPTATSSAVRSRPRRSANSKPSARAAGASLPTPVAVRRRGWVCADA